MREEVIRAKERAEQAKYLYRTGQITKAEAIDMVKEYETMFNEKSRELAEKYNQKCKKFNFTAFMR